MQDECKNGNAAVPRLACSIICGRIERYKSTFKLLNKYEMMEQIQTYRTNTNIKGPLRKRGRRPPDADPLFLMYMFVFVVYFLYLLHFLSIFGFGMYLYVCCVFVYFFCACPHMFSVIVLHHFCSFSIICGGPQKNSFTRLPGTSP